MKLQLIRTCGLEAVDKFWPAFVTTKFGLQITVLISQLNSKFYIVDMPSYVGISIEFFHSYLFHHDAHITYTLIVHILLTSNYVDVFLIKRFFLGGGTKKYIRFYKGFPINYKNELCCRFHTLNDFSKGGYQILRQQNMHN